MRFYVLFLSLSLSLPLPPSLSLSPSLSPLSPSSYLQEKTIIDHVTSVWFGFYQHYQPLVEFIEQADTDLSLINSSVKDVTKMQCMLDKIKVEDMFIK